MQCDMNLSDVLQYFSNCYKYQLQMQKDSLFQSFLQKQKKLHQKLYQKECSKDKQNLSHFQAVSHVKVINNQHTKSHLNLLQKQYIGCLKDFTQSQQSFNEIGEKLNFIQRQVQNQQYKHVEHHQSLKRKLYEIQLQNQVMKNKNQQTFAKIFQLKENGKKLQGILEEHQKIQEQKQQEVEYEKCINRQIFNKNNELFQCLEKKEFQISQATEKIVTLSSFSQHLQEKIEYQRQKISTAQQNIQQLDNTLSNNTFGIQSLLNQQNNLINDIMYYKQTQQNIQEKFNLKKEQLFQAEQIQQQLLNIQESLEFESRRCKMEIKVQYKGIDQQFWRIQKQKEMLNENMIMLQGLHEYLTHLFEQNQMMESLLEKQIVQDHTIKLIVDSKCEQPVGFKTKIALNSLQTSEEQISLPYKSTNANIQSKTFMSTSASWKVGLNNNKSNNKQSSQKQNSELKALKMRNQLLMNKIQNNTKQSLRVEFYESGNRLYDTGFTYINKLRSVQ